jgi:hypothetical protein
LEGRPISVTRARLLACEAAIIPSVFNYKSGEAIELGRALRLPNVALRRKLELEQPEGCAWSGCDRPIAWTEGHHIQHWANGGKTTAENLILLCRFHHGRIHTTGWTIEKTGPGQATITHHEDHEPTPTDTTGTRCDCPDRRTDADLDAENRGSDWDVFPTGLYRSEWAETMKQDLDPVAEAAERDRCLAAIKAAKARCREQFGNPKAEAPAPEPGQAKESASARSKDLGDPPFLVRPLRWQPGRGGNGIQRLPARIPRTDSGPSPCPATKPATQQQQPTPNPHPPLHRCLLS